MADAFLRQLERRRQQHLVRAPSHADKPFAEMGDEERQSEIARLEWAKRKSDIEYGEELRRADQVSGSGVEYGLASNKGTSTPRSFWAFVGGKRRPRWK